MLPSLPLLASLSRQVLSSGKTLGRIRDPAFSSLLRTREDQEVSTDGKDLPQLYCLIHPACVDEDHEREPFARSMIKRQAVQEGNGERQA
jgi:hypothetical protein